MQPELQYAGKKNFWSTSRSEKNSAKLLSADSNQPKNKPRSQMESNSSEFQQELDMLEEPLCHRDSEILALNMEHEGLSEILDEILQKDEA